MAPIRRAIQDKNAAGARAAKGTMRNHPYKPAQGMSMRLDKKFGQHLLRNPGILDKIIGAAEIKSTDSVLEIGPGTGNLTMRLLPVARRVTALDIDERMVGEVKKRAMAMGYTNLDAKYGDALRSDLGHFEVCTANLPYQISSPFIFKLLSHRPLFRTAVLMFQKEFADRLLASVHDKCYCRLSINTQVFCKVERVCNVKPSSFNPPPKVDSTVVKITPRKPPLQIDFKEWDGMIRIAFGRRRKLLRGNFVTKPVLNMLEYNYKTWCSLSGSTPEVIEFKIMIQEIITAVGLVQKRAIDISIEEYLELLLAFNKRGIYFSNIASSVTSKEQLLELDSSRVKDPFASLDKSFYETMEDDTELLDQDEDEGE